MDTRRILRLLCWPAAIWIAYELLWYEQYKLTGNEGSVYLFTILSNWLGTPGGEKPFRLFVAGMEIAAAVLVLIPRTQAFGGIFAAGIMAGAIFFHTVSPLGIDPYGDGGVLFKEACFTFVMGLFIAAVRREELLALARRLLRPGKAAAA
ncbi:DoxX family protein [Siccirubricoccus phaeus]|uniref:DoxX family protein n=1 Tax=Siccirubricoccus phaeus TaxID=2595053 RepID=UPI0011F35BC1|nr:DoxX family protein [Siccirubricoccus phaeus]